AANAVAGSDSITFNISGAGGHVISLTSALPQITSPVTINGYSQPGASANTNPTSQGLNAQIRIVLDGFSAGTSAGGLRIGAGGAGSTITGLLIRNFAFDGILLQSGSNHVEGNEIANNLDGVAITNNGSANTIGGTSAGARN